ncbi:MAG: DUF2635 domain-containing protein [Sphingomonadales bacterium]|nr:MAG: DUF2635 domain-containing protein [Sphingomonadales bacterium]
MKLATFYVLPAPDRRVRKPDGSLLDAVGDTVQDIPYWRRRLADEDVVIGKEPKAAKGEE